MPHDHGMKNYQGTPQEYATETAAETQTPVMVVVQQKKKKKPATPEGFKRKPEVKW